MIAPYGTLTTIRSRRINAHALRHPLTHEDKTHILTAKQTEIAPYMEKKMSEPTIKEILFTADGIGDRPITTGRVRYTVEELIKALEDSSADTIDARNMYKAAGYLRMISYPQECFVYLDKD